MYEYIPLQHITNWAVFKSNFYGGSYNDAVKASRAKYAEYLKAVECDKAIPTPPAALREIEAAKNWDIGVNNSFFARVAQAKKREDPCHLEDVATNFAIVEQIYRMYNHLRLSARTGPKAHEYSKLAGKALGVQGKVGAIWQKALLCDNKSIAHKNVAANVAEVCAAIDKNNSSQAGLHRSIDNLEVENTFAQHEKKFKVDGKETRRLSVFSH